MGNINFFDRIIFLVNWVFAFLLLLSCAVPYISVESFPSLSILSLAASLLVPINILFAFYWLLKRKGQLLLSVSILGLAYICLGSFFKFRFSESHIDRDDLSIMSYNTRIFNRYEWIDNPLLGNEIVDFVSSENPDILCFQEFDDSKSNQFEQYPYRYISYKEGTNRVIQAIFSKYPIVAKGSLNFPDSSNNAIFADVLYKEDTLRVYNLHLESLRIKPDAESLSKEPSGKLYKRLSNSFVKQHRQAEIFDSHRNATSHHVIVCGDFNNTQFSNVYKIIKGDLQDTFQEKGTGYGRTFNFKYYPVRIDFILVDKAFEVTGHKNFNIHLSDHFPVMASIRIRDHYTRPK
ncbi:endonuclease/exonuclease/phosphatase family protein [Flavobacteriaceae bacterium F89]|uniref:Endonuclease/exonuclease/phosphatase family protein n=1 Tax=Cerina litoralis TaxID=2874477 RepID=A0AAE3JPW8_9FLAO|nr:endonuclease/exonuclease/phosphatase family protein [Cerina litoralis]MCG2459598.1 endonuclease/exonuclease/phosphatase family protein [Cerina litoralis]